MDDARQIAARVNILKNRNTQRDRDYRRLIAIRHGDYDAVAPGLFTSEFPKPLVANLIDTTARDVAEVMAPLPAFHCQSAALSNETDQKRQDLRTCIVNSYVQSSKLQNQMFGGADRYGSFGFLAFIAEPDFKCKTPVIRVGDHPTAYYERDYRGRTKHYCEVYTIKVDALMQQFPDVEIRPALLARFGKFGPDGVKIIPDDTEVEVVRWYDDDATRLVLLDPSMVLVEMPNKLGRCPVAVVERPRLTASDAARGQFDDVIWVQIARALVQQYTMNALEQSVNAPVTMPKDADELEIGPFTVIQTDTPGAVGRVNLGLTPGLFPEQQSLMQEQQMGSRYPQGRTGNIDASIITGQGVQALMGTFDTQVQTFQKLAASALEDVLCMCFEMDEAYWGGTQKTCRIKDNGAARKFTYTPAKDINGDYTVDVTYGAIAGLDPNRGLVFVLQALAGGLLSKQTAMKSLPVDMNPLAETRQIQLEQVDDSISASISALPQAIPQMAMSGADPRELVMQIAQYRDLVQKGKDPSVAAQEVFAPKQPPQAEEAAEASPLEQAQGAGGGPAGLPGAGTGGASDLLMSLAGLTPGGRPNLQANVSRRTPI